MKFKTFRGKLFLFILFAILSLLPLSNKKAFAVQFLTPEERFWTTNYGSEVASIISPDGNTVYIGGNFTRVAPYTGSGVPFSISTNPPQQSINFPKISGGDVKVAIPDSQGGWYVGGTFKKVGDEQRDKLVHILANGSVDPNLSLNINNSVNALAFDSVNKILYIGGDFTSIGGQTRNRVASVNTMTGQITDLNPNVGGQTPSVRAVALDSSHSVVYIGGLFNTVGGQQRINLAGISTTTGLATATSINADQPVNSFVIDPSNNILYVGGRFTTINGQTRKGLASINTATGELSNFNISTAGVGSYAESIDLDSGNNILYVGGYFPFGTGTSTEKLLFAVNTLTNQLTNWNPSITPGSTFGALSLDSANHVIYVGGDVGYNGQQSNSVSSVDTTTGQPTSWNPAPFGYVNTLGLDPVRRLLYVGGEFGSLGGEERKGLASFSVASGRLTNWNPGVYFNENPGGVLDMVLDSQNELLYVGGVFDSIGGQSRTNLAAFNIKSSQITSWNPLINQNGGITTLALDSAAETLYVGGHFTSIGGQPRNRIGAINTKTGQPTKWDPDPTSTLYSVNIFKLVLDIPGNLVYVGGFYDSIGGQIRKNLAAVDMITGLATSWDPKAWNPNAGPPDTSAVLSLDLDAPNHGIYVGGSFKAIGNSPREGLASVDTISGLANGWNPPPVNSDPVVHDMVRVPSENVIYTAQSSASGELATGIIGIDTITGTTIWNPNVRHTVETAVFDPVKKLLYIGGPFFEIGEQKRRGFAVFASPLDEGENPPPQSKVSEVNTDEKSSLPKDLFKKNPILEISRRDTRGLEKYLNKNGYLISILSKFQIADTKKFGLVIGAGYFEEVTKALIAE